MERHEILEIWHLPDRNLRRIAVGEVMEHLPQSFELCLEMLTSCPGGQEVELVVPLRAHLPFLKEGYHPTEGLTEGDLSVFGEMYERYRAIITTLKKEGNEQLVRTCYRYFEGLRPDLHQLFADVDFSGSMRPEERTWRKGRQLMVFVTGICNLQCPYCFSSDIERTVISAEDLERIFAWAAANECAMVTPCGGEPMMYPHIQLFMDLVADYGMTTYMASNCTFPLSRFTQRQLKTIDVLTFHFTEALWKRPDYMRTFCENIELAKANGIRIIARPNLIRPDADIAPWFELIDRYDLREMYIALTIPSGAHDNLYIAPKVFADYVPVIKRCIGECRQRGIKIGFAKPIPMCVFDRETAMWMLQYDQFMPMCNNHEDGGTRNVCISPDLHIEPCPGVPQPRLAFDESLTWEGLSETLGQTIERALQKPLFERCHGCFLFHRRICQGACLSYKNL